MFQGKKSCKNKEKTSIYMKNGPCYNWDMNSLGNFDWEVSSSWKAEKVELFVEAKT